MTRGAVLLDRIVILVSGALLLAGGVAAVLWSQGRLAGARPLGVAAPLRDVDAPWWPWACGGIGVVMVLTGVWWLSVHRRSPRVRGVRLADDASADGSLTADVASVARAAADSLEQHPAVLKVGSRSAVEGGVPTITLTATIPARRCLQAAVQAADDTAATVARMLGDTVAVRTRIQVTGRDRRAPVA